MFGASVPLNIAIIPGERFKVLANSSTLRKHMTDCYWCEHMEFVCDGKLEGEVVRYTGNDLVMLKFKMNKATRSGTRYFFSLSLPAQYLVPVSLKRALGASMAHGAGLANSVSLDGGLHSSPLTVPHPFSTSYQAAGEALIPRLCVVCGRWDLPGEMRKHGYKCNGCIGTKSHQHLRNELHKLQEECTEIES